MTGNTEPLASCHFEDVAVVMITRNEEKAIGKVIDDARAALPGTEVVVIDGSSDKTPHIARAHGAIVLDEPGGGPAPALLCGLRSSDRSILVTVDADDTYPADVFPLLVRKIREGYDVVGTDRLGTRPPPAMPLANWFANVLFSALGSLRARRRLHDVHSGQRAYRREVIAAFEWDTSGLAFPVDLLLWPARAGCRITELTIPYRERVGETTLNRWPSTRETFRRLSRRPIPVPERWPPVASRTATDRD